MEYNTGDTAVVLIDPQNDVLSPTGKNWASVGASVTENNTVEHLVDILSVAKTAGFAVFVSPHYFYPTDSTWQLNGPLESDEFRTHSFARSGALTLEGFTGSGADWLDELKTYIDDGETVVASPTWGDGYQAALINYAFLAHAVVSTEEIVTAMAASTHPRGVRA